MVKGPRTKKIFVGGLLPSVTEGMVIKSITYPYFILDSRIYYVYNVSQTCEILLSYAPLPAF